MNRLGFRHTRGSMCLDGVGVGDPQLGRAWRALEVESGKAEVEDIPSKGNSIVFEVESCLAFADKSIIA
jgi:hypothetical protein